VQYHGPLVSCETLFENLGNEKWAIFDTRHDLGNPNQGPTEFGKGRIPGSHHAHIDRDLAGPVGNGVKGRHPMPFPGAFTRFLQINGVDSDTQIVVYDHGPGMWAGRLWWLLRHYGHENVAVLDGGLARWKKLHLPLDTKHPAPKMGNFDGKPGHMPTVSADNITAAAKIVDARAPDRFTGENKTMDPVSGHIPGAENRFFMQNVDADGMFLSPDELRAKYEDMPEGTAVYCGSGVTAAHVVLATEIAGLSIPALYPGSWSEWCHPNAGRPVEK
jgi:thiosulfate/3-mercaptopyruvate sulfurtransferase